MRPIDPAEISALIDGELPPERAREVRRAIAQEASLRRVYEQLVRLDTDLKAAAAQVMFQPHVELPRATGGYGMRVFLAAAVLAIVRLAMKWASPGLATIFAAALLAVVVGWVLQRLVRASEAEFQQGALSDL